jgi:hypothetical protein
VLKNSVKPDVPHVHDLSKRPQIVTPILAERHWGMARAEHMLPEMRQGAAGSLSVDNDFFFHILRRLNPFVSEGSSLCLFILGSSLCLFILRPHQDRRQKLELSLTWPGEPPYQSRKKKPPDCPV